MHPLMQRSISTLRAGYQSCTGPERLLIYSAFVPAVVSLHRNYQLKYEGFAYREFIFIFLVFLSLLIIFCEALKPGKEPRRLAPYPLVRPIFFTGGLFLLWLLLSAFWAPVIFWALRFGAFWLVYLVFLWLLVAALRGEPFRNLFLGAVLLSLNILSLINIVSYFVNGYKMEGFLDVHPLQGAELLATVLPFTVGLFLFHPARVWRGTGLISFFVFYWAILQTAKRSPFLGVFAGMAFATVMLWVLHVRFRNNYASAENQGCCQPANPILIFNRSLWRRLGLLFLLAAALTYAQLTPSGLNGLGREQYNLAKRFQPQEMENRSMQERYQFWAACYEMFKASPLAGQGAGSFRTLYRHYRGHYFQDGLPFGYFCNEEAYTVNRAHNEYLEVLGELGLVGFGLFLLFILLSLFLPLKQIFGAAPTRANTLDLRNQLLAVFALGGLIAFLVSSAASAFGFRVIVSGWAYCTVSALALALVAPATQQELVLESRKSKNLPFAFSIASLLLLTGIIAYYSFRILMGDFYFWKYHTLKRQEVSYLDKAIAWFPQHPGPHLLRAQNKFLDLFWLRMTLEKTLAEAGTQKPSVNPDDRLLMRKLLKRSLWEEIGKDLDAAYINGVALSFTPAYKALAAEVILQPALAHSVLERALDEFPDSPFLAAYYLHLSRKLDKPDGTTAKRLHFVRRFQEKEFRQWQRFFENSDGVLESKTEEFSGLAGYQTNFQRIYREILEWNHEGIGKR